MGKQSARLYYNGEDCSDLYYGGYYNLSKIYRGSTLLWERLPPKYILASGNILFTSEVLKSLSTFRQYSLNEVYNVWYEGIEYIFGLYYMMIGIKETRESESIIWFLSSENGYDWKKVYDFSDINAKDMKKYMGKLAFIAKKDDNYALCLMDSKLNIEYSFDTSQIAGVDNMDMLAIGNDTILLMDSNKEYIIVVKNGQYKTAINKSAFYSEESGSASFGARTSYDIDGGYFYISAYTSILGNCLYRSKEGISWTRFFVCPFGLPPVGNFIFDKDYIYYEVSSSTYAYKWVKVNKNDASYNLYTQPVGCICAIDGIFYFCFMDKIYKSEDLSKITRYIDSNNNYQLKNAEEVRISDKHQWTMPSIGTPVFDCVCCTDENVKIYI